jgi:hypothetical protein
MHGPPGENRGEKFHREATAQELRNYSSVTVVVLQMNDK